MASRLEKREQEGKSCRGSVRDRDMIRGGWSVLIFRNFWGDRDLASDVFESLGIKIKQHPLSDSNVRSTPCIDSWTYAHSF